MQSSNQNINLLQSSIFNASNFSTPKKAYFDQVANETSEQMKKDLIQLYDFGFVNFQVNKPLLQKYQNAEQVAQILLDGQLSESNFN